jgi:ATP-dependent RNA helicase SUPV3L1/SUV3
MEEERRGSVENDPPVAEPQPRHDFSHVQGFQLVGAERPGDEAWREALRLELEARAERLRQSVDAAIVLSNDGIIRWLGDPVAKLSLGPNVLNPGAVILADDSLPDESRATIKTRIELWISATTRRLLAPLFALDGVQEGAEIVRDLAQELVRSLGVLEREPIKEKIRTLAQDDRAELRKQGVRFGAYYLFFPTLLKPAARALTLQLWALQAPGDAGELLRTLGPIASSGRTSLPSDKDIGKDGYRVAGYRACGERIVRVDVVERLAGMIRSAIVGEAPGGADGALRQRPSKGFVISGAMTSLTGCAGEPFASILRSMGFRSVEMKRSDFFGPQSARATAEPGAVSESVENRPPTDEQSSPLPAGDEGAAAESILAAPLAEPPSHCAEGLDVAAVGSDTGPEEDAAAVAAEETPEDDDALAEEAHETVAAAQDAEQIPEDGAAVAEGADSAAAGADHATVDTISAVSDPADSAPISDANAQPAPQTPNATGEATKDADIIIVWRPDHRRASPRREREGKRPRAEEHRRPQTPPAPAPAPNWRREPAARPPNRPNPANFSGADEKRRQRPKDYDIARSTSPTPPQQKGKVDPNSPFAKLLELRSLLEDQANKRR